MASKNYSLLGSGGMVTKIWAAKICMNSGCSTIISSSNKDRPLLDISKHNSTWFNATKTPRSNRKQWLLNHLHPSGSVIIDQGALKALINNKSLLPAGVLEIKGRFYRGDVISILSEKNIKLGVGIIAYDSSDAKKIIGKNSNNIKDILGYEGRDELIHKDDLVKVSQ
jgi:glutamate 5-kinase